MAGLSTSAIKGLAAVLTVEQFALLFQLDTRMADALIIHLASWLHWRPISGFLEDVLHFIRVYEGSTGRQRDWASRLLWLDFPRLYSAPYLEREGLELDQRQQFRPHHLLALPPEVACLFNPGNLQEACAHLPPKLEGVVMVSFLDVADIILQNAHRRGIQLDPMRQLQRWATGNSLTPSCSPLGLQWHLSYLCRLALRMGPWQVAQ